MEGQKYICSHVKQQQYS